MKNQEEEEPLDYKIQKKDIYWLIFVVTAVVIRVCLEISMPALLNAQETFDDRLLFDYAESLYAGDWLGVYNNVTLVKGISFSVFLVLCHALCIQFPVGRMILLIGGSVLFLTAFKKVIRSRMSRTIVFLLLLYSPMGFDLLASQRLYRNSIVTEAVLILFSCMCGLFFRRRGSVKAMLGWAAATGISLAFFWFLREDSIWVLPFIFVVILLGIISIIVQYWRDIRKIAVKSAVLIIPVLFLGMAVTGVSVLNKHYYGIFATNDRAGSEFGKFMSYLYRIDNPEKNLDIWVPESTVEKVLDISPTFATVRQEVENSINAWGAGEAVRGDLIAWTIRDAVQTGGHYQNAQETNEFYRQINQEIQAALDEGSLELDGKLYFSKQAAGISLQELPQFFVKSFKMMGSMSRYTDCEASAVASGQGLVNAFRDMESFAGTRGISYPIYRMKIEGWIFAKSDQQDLEIRFLDSDGQVISAAGFVESPDVANVYPDYENAKKARFSVLLEGDEVQNFQMSLYLDGNEEAKLESGVVETEDYVANIEVTDVSYVDAGTEYSQHVTSIGNFIIKIYQVFSIPVILAALVGYILIVYEIIRTRGRKGQLIDIWLMITGIFLSSLVLSFGVSFFTIWFTEGMQVFIPFYAVGNYVLLQMVKYLSIIAGGRILLKRFVRKKAKS